MPSAEAMVTSRSAQPAVEELAAGIDGLAFVDLAVETRMVWPVRGSTPVEVHDVARLDAEGR